MKQDAAYLEKSTRRPLYEPFSIHHVRPGNFNAEVFFGFSTVAGLSDLGGFGAVVFALVCFFGFGIEFLLQSVFRLGKLFEAFS